MKEKVSVVFHPVNRVVAVRKGSTVLDAIRLAGIQFESICGGKGECNKCKVIHMRGECDAGSPDSIKGLTEDEIAHHYCRACRTHVIGNCEFTIPVESRIDAPRILHHYSIPSVGISPCARKYLLSPPQETYNLPFQRSLKLEGYSGTRPHMTKNCQKKLAGVSEQMTVTISTTPGFPEIIRLENGNTLEDNFGIAIDIGTTTIVGVLMDLAQGRAMAEASGLNRQITYGEELLTRIAVAKKPEGREQLRQAVITSINDVIKDLIDQAGIAVTAVNDVCVAGNTVMQYLFLGRDPSALEVVNADIPRRPEILRAHSAGIHVHPEAYIWCLPPVSRFIGGDAVGDVVASGMHESGDITLLIDLGTNGEVVIGNRDWLSSVSCASGPAFEGAGIACGMRGMKGAVDHVTIDPQTCQVSVHTIGNALPRGICGSGIIDAAAAMAGAGILDFSGRFVETKPGVRPGTDGPEFVLVAKEKTATGHDIVITRQDLLYLMDSKAAVCGAVGVLLKKYRLTIDDIRHVYLAGGFGEYANPGKLMAFGILPAFPMAVFHALGNGSVSGACAALISAKKRRELEEVAGKMVYIDLLIDADFIDEYTAALYIPGKKEYFPQGPEQCNNT